MCPLEPWPLKARAVGPDLRLFKTRFDQLENPRTGRVSTALVIESGDWCNVVARNPTGDYILVRQFRFGSGDFTLEVPGGAMDPGEVPLQSAKRELREETGYEAAKWTDLGSVAPNPAFLDNRCHHFLAEGAKCVGELQQDAGEDVEVVICTPDEIREHMRTGAIDHALALTALWRSFERD
ncbi:MAG: ADP-ribose pyrophosphatase [Planctomycetota bacterium]|jgi:ADP-ribose pyrophosphatase